VCSTYLTYFFDLFSLAKKWLPYLPSFLLSDFRSKKPTPKLKYD
jgi:hypothetical protein